jgi:hypothetical protein
MESNSKSTWNKSNILEKELAFDLNLTIYALILWFSSLLLTGYAVYTANQSIQIPLVHLLNNFSLYQNDPFGATLPYYSSMLWRVVAFANRLIPLEPLLIVLFLLERFLVIYAAGYLAQTFVSNSRLAVIGGMALFALAPNSIIGHGDFFTNYFEQTGLTIPFLLLGIASFYKSRTILWAVWIAIAFNLNSMYATYSLTYFGAIFFIDPAYRREWKRWFISLGLFLLIASPNILLTASAFGRKAGDSKLWLLTSQVRFPHHLYPLTWNPFSYLKFGILLFLFVAFLYQNRAKFEKLFRHGLIWTGVCLMWLVYAFVAAYVAKSPPMLVMHPGRATDLWYCFAGIAIISGCAFKVEAGKTRKAFLEAALIAGVLIAILTSALAPTSLGLYVMLAGVIAIAWQPAWNYIYSQGNDRRLGLLLTLWVFLVGAGAFSSRFKSTRNVKAALIDSPYGEMRQLADWASTQTPVNALFLVNPEWEHFRSLSKRPVFVTWKDSAAILWDRTYVKNWVERLRALGFDVTQQEQTTLTEDRTNKSSILQGELREKLSSLYDNLNDEDVKKLKGEFFIRYWIVPVEKSSNLPVVFKNKKFKILEVR